MTISWDISVGSELPLTLWAGVGSVVVDEAMEPDMLMVRSLVLGENWDGLCGVCGLKDMMDSRVRGWRECGGLGEKILARDSGDQDKEMSVAQCRCFAEDTAPVFKSPILRSRRARRRDAGGLGRDGG